MEIDENAANAYTDRMSRTAGALGMKMLANLRSLNVLILGCRGVGIETAKNLVLTGPKSVMIWDREPTRIVDLGANFYLRMDHVAGKVPRGDAVQQELQTLNPYCNVSSFEGDVEGICNDLLTRSGLDRFGCVIVTDLLPRADLLKINALCRQQDITFLLALTSGVTASLFSDFGPKHVSNDLDGEPTQTFAVSHMEVVKKSPLLNVNGVEDGASIAVVTVANARHGLDDGDMVEFDDLSGGLEALNGAGMVKCKRLYYKTPSAKELQEELEDNSLKSIITNSGLDKVVALLEAKDKAYPDSKSYREKQMLNRFVVDLSDADVKVTMDDFAGWSQGGLVNQKKKPVEFNHSSLEETLVCPPGRYSGMPLVTPQHMDQAAWEKGYATDIHICWAAALEFQEQKGRWPALHCNDDAKAFYEIANKINTDRAETENACVAATWSWETFGPEKRDVDETRARRFSRYFPTELTGVCAFLGGAVAQEVCKKFGKYKPISQWLHYDDQDLITDESPTNLGPLMGTRYDWQVAVLGKTFQARIGDQKVFLVGCGALGCEYLKGISLMGVATGSAGKVWVTDMDRIEVSNLSRQFLFRQENVGKPKSVCGAEVVQKWNPALNIQSLEMFVGPKTENFFDDGFWEGLNLCWNALDNVKARKYTDSRCLFYSKPLLESGTLGTKCNGEIILPFRTKSYNDDEETDDNENQIAMCTLKNFPYLPLHCIEYARQSYFTDYFEDEPAKYEQFRTNLEGFIETINKEGISTRLRILQRVKRLADAQTGGLSFADCVNLAFNQMVLDYRNNILDLTFSNPADKKKEDGSPFWSGTKRFPSALDFGYDNELAMEYLYCSANMYAFVYGVEYVRDRTEFMKVAQSLKLTNPDYTPKWMETEKEEEEVEGDEMEEEEKGPSEDEEQQLKAMVDWANTVDRSTFKPLTAHDFEKDDDMNFHIDFMTISTNLRAFNYQIKMSTRLNVKLTAGRIIPALATTTAMVCGLVELEYCKLVLGLDNQGIEKFRNSNINLGTATFNVFQPDDAIQFPDGVPKNYTSWDKIYIDEGNLTSGQFMEKFGMMFPGVKFNFLVNPNAGKNEDGEEINPVLLDVFQANVGQEALSTGEDMPPMVFQRFPAARMAAQMIKRFEEGSNNHKRFSKQLENVKTFVEEGKSLANKTLYELYVSKYGEPLKNRQDESRKYLLLSCQDASVTGDDGEEKEVTLPMIKYVFSH